MIDVPLALAFTAGMVVTVNPCGFAMLPAYLSFFIGADDDAMTRPSGGVARAMIVGASVTVGFSATFAVLALVVTLLSDVVYNLAPWLTVVVGGAALVVGIAYLLGFQLNVTLPHLGRGHAAGLGSMALFGASYAVASIGCTLPLWTAVMAASFGKGLTSGMTYFFAYAAGFGLVITTLTMAVTLARLSLVRSLRRALPYVNRTAGALLVLTGSYIAYYGLVEIRVGQSRGIPNSAIVAAVTQWSSVAQNWIAERPSRIGVLFTIIAALGVGNLLVRRSWRETEGQESHEVGDSARTRGASGSAPTPVRAEHSGMPSRCQPGPACPSEVRKKESTSAPSS